MHATFFKDGPLNRLALLPSLKKIKETTDLFTPFHRYLNKIKYAWSKYRKHTINSLFRHSAIDIQYQNVIPQTNVFLDQFSENTQLI